MTRDREQPGHDVADAVARRSYGKLLAFLAARTGDVAGAEDCLADAFAAALAAWPAGPPRNPEAWLMTVARRGMIDRARRRRTAEDAAELLLYLRSEIGERAADLIPDDRLRLMFVCAHPAIDRAVRAPLMLQTVLGLEAARIASAFLVSPAAMGQRLVRAKSKIRQARIPFRVPEADELSPRLDAVLEAIYAAFAAGWTDPEGADSRLRGLSSEGLWLGRLVVRLLPEEPEALGLLALMLHAEARRAARRGADGAYVPLSEQDAGRWDVAMIDEAESLLRQAGRFGRIGRYQLEAAVQSAHAARLRTGRSDWAAVAELYAALAELTRSPVVAVNRAVAVAETAGPQAGLAILDALADDAQLAAYQPYWAARADLLSRAGAGAAAERAYVRAIGLESDPAIRRFLQRRREGAV